MKKKKNYDKKEKLTRIHLSDYLVLKQMSQISGVSMAEALHRLIEHQAQLPLPVKPRTVIATEPAPTAIAVNPVANIATNGSKSVAIIIKPKGVEYE